MVRDLNHHKLFAQAMQAMLKEMGIQANLRTAVESIWFGDAAAGNYDLAVGAIVSTLLDPSDYFNAWYRTDGPQNYSFWHNPEFDKLVDHIDVEVDSGKRLVLIRQAEDVMEQDPPLVPVAWENILDVWYDYVKGHNPKDYFGIYDVVRFDTFWLDKAWIGPIRSVSQQPDRTCSVEQRAGAVQVIRRIYTSRRRSHLVTSITPLRRDWRLRRKP